MKEVLQKLGLAVPSLVLAVMAVVTVPAFAQHGSGDSTGDSTSTSGSNDTDTSGSGGSSTSGSGKSTTSSTENETENETETSGDLHTRAGKLVAALKQEHKSQKTAAQRTKACEAASHGLETKFTQISKNATAFQTRIDGIYAKGVTYQSDNNVTVANWSDLVAKADAAKAASAAAIAALPSAPIDCTASSPADQVAAFKLQAQTVRDDLKAYKAAVKNVLHALLDAKTPTKTETETEGSTN